MSELKIIDGLQVPIILVVFNRPNLLESLLQQIKLAKPKKLYVLADAPRVGNNEDATLCEAVKAKIDKFDLGCEVIRRYHTINLGCKKNIETGLNWVFEREESGIILEDDCLPNLDFFRFCEEMLLKYKDDPKIFSITGNNFQNNKIRGNGSYYVSKYMHCWGWATWRRAWKGYDGDLSFWPTWKNSPKWDAIHSSSAESRYWLDIFEGVYLKKIDSWAYPWLASSWYFGGNTITPNVNLVKNMGFGSGATNTKNNNGLEELRTTLMPRILIHPLSLDPNYGADTYTFKTVFKMSFGRKVKNKILSFL
jgi:hypothetical protein